MCGFKHYNISNFINIFSQIVKEEDSYVHNVQLFMIKIKLKRPYDEEMGKITILVIVKSKNYYNLRSKGNKNRTTSLENFNGFLSKRNLLN